MVGQRNYKFCFCLPFWGHRYFHLGLDFFSSPPLGSGQWGYSTTYLSEGVHPFIFRRVSGFQCQMRSVYSISYLNLSPEFCLIPGFVGSCYREDAVGFECFGCQTQTQLLASPRPRGFSLGRISVTGWGVVRPGSPRSGEFCEQLRVFIFRESLKAGPKPK